MSKREMSHTFCGPIPDLQLFTLFHLMSEKYLAHQLKKIIILLGSLHNEVVLSLLSVLHHLLLDIKFFKDSPF